MRCAVGMRDRDAGIDLGIVRTRRRRLNGMGEIVLTLTTHGVATVEIAVRFDEACAGFVATPFPDHRQANAIRVASEPPAAPI